MSKFERQHQTVEIEKIEIISQDQQHQLPLQSQESSGP
jgi:hypothetical protein